MIFGTSSKVELTTSPLTERSMSVTSSDAHQLKVQLVLLPDDLL